MCPRNTVVKLTYHNSRVMVNRNLLASGSADNNVLLWDMSRQDVASTLAHPEKIQSLQFHPFEIQTLATGCCDSSVRVYDCRSESCKEWGGKLGYKKDWQTENNTEYICDPIYPM